jgi:hypothetical protein
MHLLFALLFLRAALPAQSGCTAAADPSRQFLVGSSDSASAYRWTVNGRTVAEGRPAQTLLLHADLTDQDAGGRIPLVSTRLDYAPGRFGRAFSLAPGGTLAYAREGAVDFQEGTIELWAALTRDGDDPVYAQRDHQLFYYRASSGDTLQIALSRSIGVVYAGGAVRGQWQSAYGSRGVTRAWKAGEWHHLAFSFSASGNWMRFYVDGALAADTNERHYWPPDPTADRFYIGGTAGNPGGILIDELRILSRPMSAGDARASAARSQAIANNEVWLPARELARGDAVTFESGDCKAVYVWRGIPLSDPEPASMLLPPGTTTLPLAVKSVEPTNCAWRIGSGAEQPFDAGRGTTSHQTVLRGLSADPSTVNQVSVRCASDPDYEMRLLYRSLPKANPPFPRKGNLWGSSGMAAKGLPYAAKIDLYLGAHFRADEIRQLRKLNPNILVLTSINTVENSGLPEDYYLHDVDGKRIEVWPGAYRLNLTKQYVAEYQARFAWQTLIDSGLMADGVFFDNFFTTQSWLKADIWGRPVKIDANEDGKPDDPAWLDAEWQKGVYHELEEWRKLMPHAIASGHLPRPPVERFASIFNGDSIGFMTSDVLEGKTPLQSLLDTYHGWFDIGRKPVVMMIESTPHDQISYGYDYDPEKKIPPSTLEFARTYYPNVRFGLGMTLMNDGYFAHEYGDTWHGNDWWYDELDYNLGYPLGAAERIAKSTFTNNLVDNGGFEDGLTGWRLSVTSSGGAQARLDRDARDTASGSGAAHITVVNAGQKTDWHVEFAQYKRHLDTGKRYDLTFSAKASAPRSLGLSTQKDAPDWRHYGLSRQVSLDTAWKKYTVTFQSPETVDDARLQFWCGSAVGEVWIDDVSLAEHPPDIFRREFTEGLVLLNGTAQRQRVPVGPGFRRLKGEQAPRYEYIVDDAGPAFTATGVWRTVKYDTGEWTAAGPFYHAWNGSCRQLDSGPGQAEWKLDLREDGAYTIGAWWAAAPGRAQWTKRAVFEVVAGGRVVASATLDQSSGGDEWHTIATVALSAQEAPVVRVRNEGTGQLVADALHVRSAARYNDGAPAPLVDLEPMDAIVLAREK